MQPAMALIAQELLVNGPLLRSELAERLNLSLPSVTRLTRPLIDRGLVIEDDDRVAKGAGRPARQLHIAGNAGRFVGIKVSGDELTGVLTDLRAEVVTTAHAPLTSRDPADVARAVAELARALAGDSPIDGLGIGVGGRVRQGTMVYRAAFLGWTDVDFGLLVRSHIDAPVVVENDLVALTAAEHWFGLGRGLSSHAVVTIGAGIGYGLVHQGRVVSSVDTDLGLGGHIRVEHDGPVCIAGHRGCVNSILTIPGIERQYLAAAGHTLTFDEILDRSRDGDPLCESIVSLAVTGFARMIVTVADVAMVNDVIVAGEALRLVSESRGSIERTIQQERDPDAGPVILHFNDTGFTSWARGAAGLAIRSLMEQLVDPTSVATAHAVR